MLNKTAMIVPKLFGGSLLALALVASHDAAAQPPAHDSAPATTTQPAPSRPRVASRLLAVAAPNTLATIKGTATSMEKVTMLNMTVRLRDARSGHIVGLALTDKDGVFMFRAVNPGSYLAEVMDQSQAVVATSRLIGANAGELVSVLLKLPTTIPQIGKLLGSTTSSNAALNTQAGGVATVTAVTPISER